MDWREEHRPSFLFRSSLRCARTKEQEGEKKGGKGENGEERKGGGKKEERGRRRDGADRNWLFERRRAGHCRGSRERGGASRQFSWAEKREKRGDERDRAQVKQPLNLPLIPLCRQMRSVQPIYPILAPSPHFLPPRPH